VSGALESARRHGLRHRLLEGAELARAYPQFQLRPEDVALHEEDAGVLLPEECVRAQQELALRAGAELRFGAAAAFAGDPRETGGPIAIEANGERILAEKVVVTAGAWTSRLLPAGAGPRLTVERNVVFWFEPLRDPGAFAPPRFPIWIWDYPGHVSYGIPAVNGDAPKIAFHHAREQVDPDDFRRQISLEEVEKIRDRLARAIPGLNGRLLGASACLYTNTNDENFAIGPLAGGRVIVASACSGHGFKMSSVVGEILADLAIDGRTRHPIGFLALDRPGLS
jgi:sarcosine oxidase